MLTSQTKDTYIYNCITRKMNSSLHISTEDTHKDIHILEGKRSDTMSDNKKFYSAKPSLKPIPPHITICPPDEQDVDGSDFLPEDDVDNDVFQTPAAVTSSASTSYHDDKHKVHSGRLYLICHARSNYILSPPSRSPVTSPTQSPTMPFHFGTSPSPSTHQWTSPISSSPSASPTPPSSPKVSVFVRVYRCNSEHFAVITRDPIYTVKPTYINMRHSRVMPGNCLGRFIVAGHCDSGNAIEFEVPELSSLEQWLDAFQVNSPAVSPSRTLSGSSSGSGGGGVVSPNTPPIPRSPVLPTLAETDEDD